MFIIFFNPVLLQNVFLNFSLFLQICNDELFGKLAEEKEVEGIIGKLAEARSNKSYDTYGLLSRFVSQTSLPKIVLPLKEVIVNS